MNAILGLIKKSDFSLMHLFNRRLHCEVLNVLFKNITHFGSTQFSAFLVIALFVIPELGIRLIGVRLLSAVLISQVIVQTIKRIVNRPRPYKAHMSIIPINAPNCQYSFPSGHTCAAFILAIILGMSLSTFYSLFLLIALLVGLSRIYLGVHYPTDVLIGAFIAYVSVKLVMLVSII